MYKENYNYWLNHKDLDPSLKEELNTLSEKEIEDAFYTDVKFQTAGMRGLMGVGTNRLNIHTVRKATMGYINYLKSLKEHPVIAISYDNRNHSSEFAFDSAKLMASYGIETYVASSLRPTPELSFMVRHFKADGGIMITASHNPKEYNGYKLYDKNGCQLVPDLAAKVIDEIAKLDDVLAIKPSDNYDASLIHEVDKEVDEAYYAEVLSIRLHKDVNKEFKIAFSPEHGASNWPVRDCLKEAGYDVVVVEEQCVPDGNFSKTKTPNPEEAGAYERVLEVAKENDAELVLVCDPDGDRMGVGIKMRDGSYKVFNGNQTGALLLEYILHSHKELGIKVENPVMFNTIVTSDVGEEVAKSYGVETEKTLTGFKYIGDKVAKYEINNEKNYVFGYEESYGSLIKPFVRDKDATQACVLLAEACAYYREHGKNLDDVMNEIYARVGAYYDSQMSISLPGADGAVKLQAIMTNIRNNPIKEIEGIKVYKWEDYKTRQIHDGDKVLELSGYDVTDVLKYYFEDGSFVAVRPSGTEPKCKVYFSMKADTYENAKAKNDRFHEAMSAMMK